MIRFAIHLILLSALAALSVLFVSGCNIASAVGYVAHQEPTFEAKYQLADVPTVIFIDDRKGRVNPTRLRRVIVDEATTQLMEEGVISEYNMISPRDAMLVARRHDRSSGEPIAMSRVGELVGAEQMIYIHVNDFALTYDGVIPQPKSISRVRVLDLASGRRVFPDPDKPDGYEGYYQLVVELPKPDPHKFNTIEVRNEMSQQLALLTGDNLAKLFFKHMKSELGDRLSP